MQFSVTCMEINPSHSIFKPIYVYKTHNWWKVIKGFFSTQPQISNLHYAWSCINISHPPIFSCEKFMTLVYPLWYHALSRSLLAQNCSPSCNLHASDLQIGCWSCSNSYNERYSRTFLVHFCNSIGVVRVGNLSFFFHQYANLNLIICYSNVMTY